MFTNSQNHQCSLTSRLRLARKKFYLEHYVCPSILAVTEQDYVRLKQHYLTFNPFMATNLEHNVYFLGAKLRLIRNLPDVEFKYYLDEETYLKECSPK